MRLVNKVQEIFVDSFVDFEVHLYSKLKSQIGITNNNIPICDSICSVACLESICYNMW